MKALLKPLGIISLMTCGTVGAAAALSLLFVAPLQADETSNQAAWNTNQGSEDSEQYQAMHAPADRDNGIEVYEVCAGCHRLEGWGTPDGTFPQLAGQHRTVLVKQLADIRAGNRDNATMYPFAGDRAIGGVQAMADVTDYIAKLPMNPANGVGAGDNLDHGAKLYQDNCAQCHGDNGEGNAEKYYPLIQGQHYRYMLRQFKWIRDGKRRNANPDMVKQIAGFSDADMQAVVDYASRLKPAAEKLAPAGWTNPDYD